VTDQVDHIADVVQILFDLISPGDVANGGL
jgi:hypothetical protein